MEFSRRTALLVAGISLLAGLTGCPVPLSKDIQLVVTGMDAVGKALLAMPGLSAEQKSNITQAVASMDAAAKKLSEATPTVTTPAPSDVATIVSLVNSIISVAATIPGLPLPVSAGLAAASVLLPIIEAAAGLPPTPAAPPPPGSAAAARYVPPVTAVLDPDEARAILQKLGAAQQSAR
jgi:hypothetical protein